MMRALPAFAVASLVALSGAAGFARLVGGATFAMGQTQVPVIYVAPPLIGLALFQLVFGLLCTRWRGLRFWLTALPMSTILWVGGLYLLLEGRIEGRVFLGAEVMVHLMAGLIALRLTRVQA
ncbi:hypothetical protein [Paracoccus sp. (in: a-proteobacteria)]|uniref:hypothetical protein n=1 Tax=Paracoccus sp. TaxID=267 RepID=UPI00396CE71C